MCCVIVFSHDFLSSNFFSSYFEWHIAYHLLWKREPLNSVFRQTEKENVSSMYFYFILFIFLLFFFIHVQLGLTVNFTGIQLGDYYFFLRFYYLIVICKQRLHIKNGLSLCSKKKSWSFHYRIVWSVQPRLESKVLSYFTAAGTKHIMINNSAITNFHRQFNGFIRLKLFNNLFSL